MTFAPFSSVTFVERRDYYDLLRDKINYKHYLQIMWTSRIVQSDSRFQGTRFISRWGQNKKSGFERYQMSANCIQETELF